MPTTLLTFKTNLYGPLARNDSVVAGYITRGVNFACTAIALLYDPPELHTSGTVVVDASNETVSIAELTRLMNIRRVFNETSNKVLYKIPFKSIDTIAPLDTAAAVHNRFYSREGFYLHVRPLSSVANTLAVSYSQYPVAVLADGTKISFSGYDSLVETLALSYTWACLEEVETSAMWQKLGDMQLLPQQVMNKTRRYLEGGPSDGNDA